MSKRKQYQQYLDDLYTGAEVFDLTEHCWAGNDKSLEQKTGAFNLAEQAKYGTILKLYDPIAFNVGFSEWEGEQE